VEEGGGAAGRTLNPLLAGGLPLVPRHLHRLRIGGAGEEGGEGGAEPNGNAMREFGRSMQSKTMALESLRCTQITEFDPELIADICAADATEN